MHWREGVVDLARWLMRERGIDRPRRGLLAIRDLKRSVASAGANQLAAAS